MALHDPTLPGTGDDVTADEIGPSSPRRDFVDGLAWMAVGAVIAVASWNMDRLENQDINPYTVPGLVPGLLGIAMVFFGGLMFVRSLRAGGLAATPSLRGRMTDYRRVAVIIGLCLVFAVALVGHGLPFWLAAALYVTASISILQYRELRAAGRLPLGLARALVIGLCAGALITLVFERIFLVRLP